MKLLVMHERSADAHACDVNNAFQGGGLHKVVVFAINKTHIECRKDMKLARTVQLETSKEKGQDVTIMKRMFVVWSYPHK